MLLLAACGTSSTASSGSSATPKSLGLKSVPAIKPPAFIPGPLDGQSTPRAVALRRPLAIIIENYSPESRPQTGLSAASTVIETLAEGGITRFMGIYLEHDAPKVGPVRSTRMYFDNWAAAFHAILNHVGGNDDAQNLLWHLPSVFNVDENRWEVNLYDTGTPIFWRSADRAAPHNMYTSTFKTRAYAYGQHQDWAYTQAYFVHKQWAPLKQRGHSGQIAITFMNPLNPIDQPDYDVRYVFNRASDTYTRFMGGSPHIDAATGKALAPSNVVIMRTGDATADPNAGPTPESILIPTIGKGRAWVFRDGTVQASTWQQANTFAPLRFYDRKGRQIALNPGQTWIEVVPASSHYVSWSFR